MKELRSTFDMNRRIEIYHKIHKIVHEEAPYTFFCSQMAVCLAGLCKKGNVSETQTTCKVLFHGMWIKQWKVKQEESNYKLTLSREFS